MDGDDRNERKLHQPEELKQKKMPALKPAFFVNSYCYKFLQQSFTRIKPGFRLPETANNCGNCSGIDKEGF
jgi:hypothetical protein